MKTLLAICRRLLVLGAWLIVSAAIGLFVLEESGVMADILRRRVAWRLGPLGEGLEIERVSLRWFEPGIVVEGISLRAPRDGPEGLGADGPGPEVGREMVRLRSLHVTLSTAEAGRAPVRNLHVDGGRVRISDDLLYGFDRIIASFSSSELEEGLLPPRMLFSHIDVALELPDGAALELGRVDLAAEPVGEGEFDLRGQLLPHLAGAVPTRGAILIAGRQDEAGMSLHASARNLLLSTRSLALPASLPAIPIEEFEGALTLEGEGRLDWSSGTVEVGGDVRASISGARLAVRADAPAFEGVGLELEANFQPRSGGGLWDRSAWSAAARGNAVWREANCVAWGSFGRAAPAGSLAKTWLRIDDLDIGPGLQTDLAGWADLSEVWTSLEPRGTIDATVDLTLPAFGNDTPFPPPSLSFHVRPGPDAGVTYHGIYDWRHDVRFGMPVPAERVTGDVVAAFDASVRLPWRVGFVDIRGEHPSGTAFLDGQISEPSEEHPYVPTRTDLHIRVPSIAIDEHLERALAVNVETETIWADYGPGGGTASADFRLQQSVALDGSTGQLDIDVQGATASWHEIPVPLSPVAGRLRMRWGAHNLPMADSDTGALTRPFGITYDFNLEEPGAGGLDLALSGFARHDFTDLFEVSEQDFERRWVSELGLDIRELPLRGSAWDVLASRYTDVAEIANDLAAKGRVHARIHNAQPAPEAPTRSGIEVVPGDVVELAPTTFPLRTRELDGRVLVETIDYGAEVAPQTKSRVDLHGSWPGGARVAVSGELQVPGETLDVHAAGFDLANQSFRGAVLHANRADQDETKRGEEELRADVLRGPLDGRIELAPSEDRRGEEGVEIARLELFLRENDYVTDEVRATHLRGPLERVGDGLRAARLYGKVGGADVTLSNVAFSRMGEVDTLQGLDAAQRTRARNADPRGYLFLAEVELQDLSLAPGDLLSWMPTLEFSSEADQEPFAGWVDIDRGKLVVFQEHDGRSSVFLRGAVRPHDLDLRLGLPISLHGANIDLRELIVEDKRVRAWGSVSELDASIAERRLENASMIVSYVDGRLTIDQLAGDFEGGRLSSLGGAETGGTGLAVELAPPHAFDLYLRLDDVHVDRFLRGVFHSDIIDEGLVSFGLRLQGSPEDVLGLSGSGWARLKEGKLWSIPVVRALLGQLGFDETATFDSLRARYRLREGRLHVPHMDIRSSLMHLVGDGTLDLDGGLHFDLEARYSLVDRLGLFSKLLYWLNKSLWRVTIRGDMSRPRVALRSAVFELFNGFRESERRSLPLPPFAAPDPRF